MCNHMCEIDTPRLPGVDRNTPTGHEIAYKQCSGGSSDTHSQATALTDVGVVEFGQDLHLAAHMARLRGLLLHGQVAHPELRRRARE